MANANRIRRIQFSTGRIIKRSRTATTKAFKQAAKEMTVAITNLIDTPGPPRSKPGSPPHVDTGNLLAATKVVSSGRQVFVRTPQYGIFLDGGTSRMAARPFIRKAIHDKRKFWERRINLLMRQNS